MPWNLLLLPVLGAYLFLTLAPGHRATNRLRHQQSRIAKLYIETWDRIGGLKVYLPVAEIVSAMPFDEIIFRNLDGNRGCCDV